MRPYKPLLVLPIILFLIAGCNNDEGGDKLLGSMRFSTVTNGTIDASHNYLFTFSGLVGDLEIPNGIQLGPNSDTTITFNRVGERLSIYMQEVPTACGNISSKSTTSTQIGFNDNPSEPGAVHESIFITPIDGSTGTIEFTVECN